MDLIPPLSSWWLRDRLGCHTLGTSLEHSQGSALSLELTLLELGFTGISFGWN